MFYLSINFTCISFQYLRYVDTHGLILEKLERVLSDPNVSPGNFRFGQVFRDFESQKVCYLPLTTLILKPLHRILHYELLLERKFFFLNNLKKTKKEVVPERNVRRCTCLSHGNFQQSGGGALTITKVIEINEFVEMVVPTSKLRKSLN